MDIDELPGELIMWVLIVSELLVFAAGVTAMSAMQLTDPPGFSAARAMLDGRMAALNTVVLVTSGLLAARAEQAAGAGDRRGTRVALTGAALGGLAFLGVKAVEYARDLAAGAGMDGHPFFTFYFLLTGFHAAHVIAGVAVLALVGIRARPDGVQAGAMFWHMVDLVWVMILPPIYLMG